MKQQKTGRKLPRFAFFSMICLLLVSFLLTGCGQPKYEAIDLEGISSKASGGSRKQNGEQPDDMSAKEDEAWKNLENIETEAMLPLQEMPGGGEQPEDGRLGLAAGEESDGVFAGEEISETETGTATGPEAALPVFNGHVVAIDAGHQAKANMEKEPIGPSSATLKAKMPEGNVGTATGVKEHELTLTVAGKLEAELCSRGYQVVMTREGSDIDLSNAERAAFANKSGADIFILLHANSMDNSGVYGALTMCMSSQNPFHPNLHDRSYRLCKKIVDHICAQTGTKNRGVQETDNFGEINWSEIPVSVVEMGFLSNPDEDRWMQDEGYQDKLVNGIAGAVDSYFAEEN